MELCDKCGSPLCGNCGKCIDETHPKRPDGSIVQFGSDCPFPEEPKDALNAHLRRLRSDAALQLALTLFLSGLLLVLGAIWLWG